MAEIVGEVTIIYSKTEVGHVRHNAAEILERSPDHLRSGFRLLQILDPHLFDEVQTVPAVVAELAEGRKKRI